MDNQNMNGGNIPTSNKPKFPTEIVELPSKGLLYPKDNPLSSGKIELKYMTAKEEDILTKKFKLLFDHWLNVIDMSAMSIADKVYSDKIQIFFDLNGYTGNNLIEVFIYKPSPIQISWAGYLSSTGLKEIEYIIADPYVVTNNFSNFFTEKPLILNDIWSILTCFEKVEICSQIPFYKNGFITFGSFNNQIGRAHV